MTPLYMEILAETVEKTQNSNLWIFNLLIFIHINMPKSGDSDFFNSLAEDHQFLRTCGTDHLSQKSMKIVSQNSMSSYNF